MSILLPTLTERRFIRDCLDSIAAQDYENLLEVLVLDGGSSDGTRQIVESFGPPFELIDNPGVTAASGLNLGIERAKGDVIVRMDAHAVYAADYVRRCVDVLRETGADNVGGRMRAVGRNGFARAVAAITNSPFGVGAGKFHHLEHRADVDTVFLGCWRRETLAVLGGFDDRNLQWAAEDHELNLRLRRSGGRVVLDPSIVVHYFARETPAALAKQYRNYGIGKISTLKKHKGLPTLRPLAPAALVGATAAGLIAGRGARRLAVPAAHAAACVVVAWRVSRQPGVSTGRALAALEICHWSYGAGLCEGLARLITRRPFDRRPRKGR